MTQLDFQHKNVWVTGAGSGIGLATAQGFAQLGAHVIGLDKAFPTAPVDIQCESVDLASASAVASLCQRLLQARPQVDVLVHAAGVLRGGGLMQLSADDWTASMASNASAIFYLSQQIAPVFQRQKSGVMVTVASNAATTARQHMTAYCASKAAALSLTNCMALELAAFNVRCNTVSPGSTDTPMLRAMVAGEHGFAALIAGLPAQYKLGIPLQKIATTQEVTQAVLFLASDMASHITMQNIIVDGGATLNA
ncbi:MAG: 2,3-dihydro-2,3-dihydroxybenzoate dehydrogenase [Neisseriaceae bacterium]|nr:2,3-dihydro-2,3-dihydroxybenzoate dehydrogenase [Neisseriaceae bacterium]MBP6861049.1 2,3-dihydro-2,3-dihydroxybenzoate dehydrogenase [Neisseriaceae bacterium]